MKREGFKSQMSFLIFVFQGLPNSLRHNGNFFFLGLAGDAAASAPPSCERPCAGAEPSDAG